MLWQRAFEPIDHFEMALKRWIGATLVDKGIDLVHRALPTVLPMSRPSSQVKNHMFFRKDAEFAIVDPKDDKIVDIIK